MTATLPVLATLLFVAVATYTAQAVIEWLSRDDDEVGGPWTR